jgi:hypothetical protein
MTAAECRLRLHHGSAVCGGLLQALLQPAECDAEAQCLNELVDDVNVAEHIGPLFQSAHIVEQRLTLFALRPRAVRVGEEKSLGARTLILSKRVT